MITLIILSFVVFRNDSLTVIVDQYKSMFGLKEIPFINTVTIYYLRSYSWMILIAIVGATPLSKKVFHILKEKNIKNVLDYFEPIIYIGLLLIVTGYLVDDSFNPFLYFRF